MKRKRLLSFMDEYVYPAEPTYHADGWEPPAPVVLPDDDVVETTRQDHDDPSAPLRVTGGDEVRRQ